MRVTTSYFYLSKQRSQNGLQKSCFYCLLSVLSLGFYCRSPLLHQLNKVLQKRSGTEVEQKWTIFVVIWMTFVMILIEFVVSLVKLLVLDL
mmetsp:Transcript_9615/g.35692  ORF Transcript_9615/g.35692 Transcript_9615/m.35692 type:complete len:91 (+) Transcript_9615:129-401(+)